MESINPFLLQFPVSEHDGAMPSEDANNVSHRVTISVAHGTAASGRENEG